MNKIGIYYAYWEQEWHSDYLMYIKKASALGFDVLELAAGALPDMTMQQRTALAAAARDCGITLTYCIGLPQRYDLASPDSAIRHNGMAYVETLLKCIAQMGGSVLGGILYSAWPSIPDQGITDKSPWLERAAASVSRMGQIAGDLGITYCLEIVNRFEQYLLNTVEEGKRFVNRVGCPHVKLLLDTFHMNIEEDAIGQSILDAKGYIGHFHIGETNRKTPGSGHMPWAEIADALVGAGYTGHIVMEPFVRMGGTVGKDIRVWRDLVDPSDARLDSDAQLALTFIRSVIDSARAKAALLKR